jgi:putative addiction module CopG family antidote
MPTDQTRNVSPTAELNAFVRARAASGQHRNAGEVVRAGLPLLQKEQQRVRREGGAPAPNPSYAR